MLKQRIFTAVLLMLGLVAASTMMSLFMFSMLIAAAVLIAAHEWSCFFGEVSAVRRLLYVAIIAGAMLLAGIVIGLRPGAEELSVALSELVLMVALGYWLLVFVLLRGFPSNKQLWNGPLRIALMGVIALVSTWVGVTYLKSVMPDGLLVLALIVLVAAVDVGAYFAGVNFGRRKLAPSLSPNKSWEGVWGGAAVCLLLAAVFAWVLHRYVIELSFVQLMLLLLMSLAITFFSVVGDLSESMLKRNCNVKDSGKLLPGHGGLLDRVDGLVAATPIFVLIITRLVAGSA